MGLFEQWWRECGSGIRPNETDDMESHAKRVAMAAWVACLGWAIVRTPKPIPDRRFDYDFYHENYDGADGGNGLAGTAGSFEDAIAQIEVIEGERRKV